MANGIDPVNPKKFKYTLDIRGVDQVVLFNSPDGWLQTNIKYTRSKVYGGLLRSFTLPLKFVYFGAKLLRREFYTYGLLARVNLLIEKLNYKDWTYSQLYLGKIDFSQFLDDQVESVTVNSAPKDITIQIDAYDSVEYAIPFPNDNNTIDVKLNPLTLGETASLIVNTTPDFRANAFFQTSIASNQQLGINPSVQNSGFLAQAPPVLDDTQVNFFFLSRTDNNKVRISTPVDSITNIADPQGIQTSCSAGQWQFNIYKSDGTLVKTLYTTPVLSTTTQQNFGFDFSVTLNTNDRLFFYVKNMAGIGFGSGPPGVNIQRGAISLSYSTISPPTYCKALRASYVYNYLIDQMNGQENPVVITQSNLLNIELKNLAITCSNSILTSQLDTLYQAGDNLQIGGSYVVLGGQITYVTGAGITRSYNVNDTFTAIVGFPTFTTTLLADGFVRQISVNPQIILSFKDFFQSIYAVKGAQAALGLDNGVLCLEDLSYFFRQGIMTLDLGTEITANSFKLTPNLDVAFNTIKVGYQDQQYDAINGSQEVNSEQVYTTNLTTPVKELNLISPIRADAYGIEAIRTTPGFGNVPTGQVSSFYVNTAASKSDNDVFFLWLKDAPETGHTHYQPLTVSGGTMSFSGVDPSYYNWVLSPKQNLLRGGNYVASVLDKMKGYQIILKSALKNANMVTVDLTGRRVAEADPVNISDLGAQIFLPYYVTVNTGLEFNAQELLDGNPYGEIWFTYGNVKYKGFINEVSVDEGQNTSQDFKLILTPGNKTSDFILPITPPTPSNPTADLLLDNDGNFIIDNDGNFIDIT